MADIKSIQEEIIEDFALFEDWTDKYSYIIDVGKNLPGMDEQFMNDDYRVKGCQSQVWLHAFSENGKVRFEADSDAILTKGLIGLLIRVYDDQTPDDILNNELFFIDKIGMHEHLSPTRSNGLASMIKKMKMYAIGFKTLQENNAE